MLKRLFLNPLSACVILAGCAASPTAPTPGKTGLAPVPPVAADAATGTADVEVLRNVSASSLSPKQGMEPQNAGQRIRWAGAVQHIAPTDKGVCLTILYALDDGDGFPRWSNDPTYQVFNACTTGFYDPELVHASTNVTVVGRISGRTQIGMGGGEMPGPVVEIERLFRWSDCLEGDAAPVCYYGFLSPKPQTGK